MQVTETSSEGLKRELKVVIGAGELSDRFSAKLNEIKDRVSLKGFRPGKVPVAHLKRVYGRSVMAEVLQDTVSETSQKAIEDRKERAALTPQIKLTEDQSEIENILVGKSDLSYGMTYEVIPNFEVTGLDGLALERPVAEVTDADIDKSIGNLVEGSVTFEPRPDHAASDGDRVTIDFTGSIDGAEFEGGKGEDAPVVIGRGGFIPGFEDGLKGAKAGDERTVTAAFPEKYPEAKLAGKPASFAVKVKEVAIALRPAVDDELAKRFGFNTIAELREGVKGRLQREFSAASRSRVKRALLDELDAKHSFPLPPTLVEGEFNDIWNRLNEDLKRSGRTFADECKTEEGERAEYQKLAERRVRLGLILSEIGASSGVKVTEDEMARAVRAQAGRFPGREAQVYKFYRENPRALLHVRAPIFEEKVVNTILEKAKITDKPVQSEELFKDLETEVDDHDQTHEHHDHDHGHDHGHDHHHGHDHDHDHHHHDHGDHDHDHHHEKGHSQG
jgi:trigger factor